MHEISIKAEELFSFWGVPVTNALLLAFIVMLVLIGVAFYMRKRNSLVPGRLQNFIEYLLEKLLELMDSVLGSRSQSERYLPLIGTIFIFIMISNWFGLLPIVGSLGITDEHHHFIPLLRSPAADLNFTLALATISVFGVNILGVFALGIKKHFSKYFSVKHGPVITFVGLLEFISEFIKIISFSFRLFGNVFAGEVLLIIVGFLVPYFIPLPFLFLELFVGFIQAFIFSMLTLVFVAMAVTQEAH